jgi:hypothetical protein
MPGTARDLGVDPLDTKANIAGSVRYMAQLLKKYGGDQVKAAAAYNWGAGNLDKDIAAHGSKWADFLPKETERYVHGFDGSRATVAGTGTAPARQVAPAAREVKVLVVNATGGSAIVSSSQAAAS